jgi:hypothetical protein
MSDERRYSAQHGSQIRSRLVETWRFQDGSGLDDVEIAFGLRTAKSI